jgi:hypothetical protein
LLDFFDSDMLQLFNFERVLIDQMVPFARHALVAAWRDPPATPNLMCEPESLAHVVSGDFVFVDDPGFRLGLRAPVLPG